MSIIATKKVNYDQFTQNNKLDKKEDMTTIISKLTNLIHTNSSEKQKDTFHSDELEEKTKKEEFTDINKEEVMQQFQAESQEYQEKVKHNNNRGKQGKEIVNLAYQSGLLSKPLALTAHYVLDNKVTIQNMTVDCLEIGQTALQTFKLVSRETVVVKRIAKDIQNKFKTSVESSLNNCSNVYGSNSNELSCNSQDFKLPNIEENYIGMQKIGEV